MDKMESSLQSKVQAHLPQFASNSMNSNCPNQALGPVFLHITLLFIPLCVIAYCIGSLATVAGQLVDVAAAILQSI